MSKVSVDTSLVSIPYMVLLMTGAVIEQSISILSVIVSAVEVSMELTDEPP